MNVTDIKKVLSMVGSTVCQAQHREHWLTASCPFAPWDHDGGIDKNPSFGISLKSKKSHYHCFSCNASGELANLPMDVAYKNHDMPKIELDVFSAIDFISKHTEYSSAPDFQENFIPEVEEEHLFPDWWLNSFMFVFENPEGLAYVRSRGLTDRVIQKFNLRYDTSRRRVVFPLRNWDGELVGAHGRAIDKGVVPSYYFYSHEHKNNKLPWLGEHYININKPVLVVESVFDLAAVWPIYNNSICPLSAGLSKQKIQRIHHIPHIVTMFDYGKGGDAARNNQVTASMNTMADMRSFLRSSGVSFTARAGSLTHRSFPAEASNRQRNS